MRRLLAILVFAWLGLCAPAYAIIAIGSSTANNIATGNTSNTITLTDANTNVWVCVAVLTERTSAQASLATVVSVTDVVGITFTKRAANSATAFGSTGAWENIEEWCGFSSSAIAAAVITVTVSAIVDDGVILGWTIDGANTSTLFDTNGSLPATPVGHVGSSIPTSSAISTSCSPDMVVLIAGSPVATAAQTNGSGYTIIVQQNNGGGVNDQNAASQQQVFATNQSGITPAFGTAWQDWLVLADAWQQAGATCAGGGTVVPIPVITSQPFAHP